jgi:hypothetical protein
MAWWDDAAEAVGSGVGWLGDAAEAVVDTATEVVEEVTESGSDAADAGLDALRDGAASVGPALGAVANVVLGVVKAPCTRSPTSLAFLSISYAMSESWCRMCSI